MKNDLPSGPKNDIETYRRLRKTIGWLGMSLPLVLVILSIIPFFDTKIQKSISYYYYTNLREILTGILCAVSLFLIRYKGVNNPVFWRNDDKMTNLAGIMALGVAIIPTNPVDCSEKIYTLIPYCVKLIGWLHYFFAASFFIILAIISIAIFTIGQNRDTEIRLSRLNENNIYTISGYVILVCIVLIPVFESFRLFRSSTLLLEAIALIAFGISWLIKGRILGDRGKIGMILYRERN